jgi:hypothetical protein
MTKEAMTLALEALEIEDAACRYLKEQTPLQIVEAITAIKQALAAPVQEPVAEVVWGAKTGFEWKFKMLVELACVEDVPVKLYAGPFKGAALYWHDTETDKAAAPPAAQRQWVGLTDEEIEKACVPLGAAMMSFTEVARAIETKLKNKNAAAQPVIPDAMTSADIEEHIEYVAGWNDCRQAMLEMMK